MSKLLLTSLAATTAQAVTVPTFFQAVDYGKSSLLLTKDLQRFDRI